MTPNCFRVDLNFYSVPNIFGSDPQARGCASFPLKTLDSENERRHKHTLKHIMWWWVQIFAIVLCGIDNLITVLVVMFVLIQTQLWPPITQDSNNNLCSIALLWLMFPARRIQSVRPYNSVLQSKLNQNQTVGPTKRNPNCFSGFTSSENWSNAS